MGTSTTDSGIVWSLRLAAKRRSREGLNESASPRSEKQVHVVRRKGGAKALESAAKEIVTMGIAKPSVDRDARKKVVMAALHNLGNTCFMNSILQVLYHTPQFCEKIHILGSEVKSTMLALDILEQLNYGGLQAECHLEWVFVSRLDKLLKQMKKIDADVLEGKVVQFAAIRPYELLDAIEEINSDFQGNQPQDAHELLKCLLMIIDETTDKLNLSRSVVRKSIGDVAPILITSPKVKRANSAEMGHFGLPALFGGSGDDAPSSRNVRFEYFDGISQSADRSEVVTSTHLESERRRGTRGDCGFGVNFSGRRLKASADAETLTFDRNKCLKRKLQRAGDEISLKVQEAPSGPVQPGVLCSETPQGVHSSARVSIPRLDSPRGLRLANIGTGYASSMVTELFQGYMLLKTKCLSCGTESTRKEEFQEVSLPFKRRGEAVTSTSNTEDGTGSERDHVSVLDLILSILDEVELLDCDNLYLCNNCRHLVKAERRLCYELLPNILTIHLKRFASSVTGNFAKISDSVDIPLELPCLETSCRNMKAPCHRYDLYGIVSHSGKSLLSGHYRAYVRVPSPSSSLTRCSLPVVQLHNIASGAAISDRTSQSLSHNNSQSMIGRSSPSENHVTMTPESSDVSSARKTPSSGRTSVRKKRGTSSSDATKESFHTSWHQCNDDVVTALNTHQLLNLLKASGNNTPYMLFYHKVTLTKDNCTDCSNRWQSL